MRCEALTIKDKVIHEQGLVSILKQLHDDLDAAVFDAYGWPHDLIDEQILERLVALNHQRAEEEKRGHIRYLRPEYQNPAGRSGEQGRLAVDAPAADSDTDTDADDEAAALASSNAPAARAPLTPWPKKLAEQVAAARDLITPGLPWSTAAVTRAFASSSAEQVEDVLDSLAALGMLIAIEQDGAPAWTAPAPPSSRGDSSARPRAS